MRQDDNEARTITITDPPHQAQGGDRIEVRVGRALDDPRTHKWFGSSPLDRDITRIGRMLLTYKGDEGLLEVFDRHDGMIESFSMQRIASYGSIM